MTLTLEQFRALVKHLAKNGPLSFRVIDPSLPEETQRRLNEKRREIVEAYWHFRRTELPRLHEYFDPATGRSAQWSNDYSDVGDLPDELNPNVLP